MEQVLADYPFRSVFSLDPLLDYWGRSQSLGDGLRAGLVADINQRLAAVPELAGPIEDLALLEPHGDLLKTLMSVIFPDAAWESEAIAAMVPLILRPVLVSPEFARLAFNGHGPSPGRHAFDGPEYAGTRVLTAYRLILKQVYGISADYDLRRIRTVTDSETGLARYVMLKPDFRFVEVRNVSGPASLSEKEKAAVLDHLTEPEALREILRPESFEFHGFTVVHAVDVTQGEVVSALERDLIDRSSMFSQEGFMLLQERLRTLFRKPQLMAGIAAISEDKVLLMQKGCNMAHNCIFASSQHIPTNEFRGSVFERAIASGGVMRIRDIAQEAKRTRVDDEILSMGMRSLLIAPLYYKGDLIGLFDLCSPNPGDLGPTDAMLLEHILPVFSMALRRGMEELENNVQAIIKAKCTAVHPSVEWRFRRAVFDHLERHGNDLSPPFEPIVFRDVYPLYGASDIRGSSEGRNRAIQADLTEHLKLALAVVAAALKRRSLPLLRELAHRIGKRLDEVERGVAASQEVALVRFIRSELEPLFATLRTFGSDVAEAIAAYQDALDSDMGTVYKQRRDFEESISLFNQRISAYLDREEAEAQKLFPHYFSKHQTDGVDYIIYIGASMVEDGGFDELYVRNLRLWQLMVAGGIAWRTERLKLSLKAPLDSTHLVLMHHAPLSIRFRFDEKRFDVDGAYDVGHEIIRSRIDKATVKGSGERLTQPGKIAIVYSRPEEAQEMACHIEFLQSEGILTNDVEHIELDDLPGVQGLKAIRVKINLESPILAERALGAGL